MRSGIVAVACAALVLGLAGCGHAGDVHLEDRPKEPEAEAICASGGGTVGPVTAFMASEDEVHELIEAFGDNAIASPDDDLPLEEVAVCVYSTDGLAFAADKTYMALWQVTLDMLLEAPDGGGSSGGIAAW